MSVGSFVIVRRILSMHYRSLRCENSIHKFQRVLK